MAHHPQSTAESTRLQSDREKFRQLSAEWKSESKHISNSAQMAMLRSYQRIIGMGAPAVPFLLEELRREPDHWFWALESITGDNPVPPEAVGRLHQMADAWIKWGQLHGYDSK